MNIGRLGALAVALGIGWALAGPACSASAAPADDDGAGSAATSTDRGGAARPAPGKRAATAAAPAAASVTAAPAAASVTAPAAGRTAAARPAAAVSAAKRNESPAPAATHLAPAAAAAVTDVTPAAEPVATVAVEAVAETVAITATIDTVEAVEAVATAYGVAPQPTGARAAARTQRAATHVAVVTATVQSVTSADALGSTGGGNPAQAAVAWSVAAWARREFELLTAGPTATADVTATNQVTSPNLLTNPGAELGDDSPSGNSTVSIPGWTVAGTPTVIEYGAARNSWPIGLSFAMPDLPGFMGYPTASSGPSDGGAQFFGGGNVDTSTLTQTVDLRGAGAQIDLGSVSYNLSGWLGGWLINPSSASVEVTFLDSNRLYLGADEIGPVSMFDRWFQTGLRERETSGVLPEGTRYAQVVVTLEANNPIGLGFNAEYNPAFADNISFTVGAALPAPAAPVPAVSTVGDLDHVFMVYMENKGYTDIVGSPNAPFLNSLINAYGFANNYFGLTHPSLPNYYPVIGGTDFGLTYNCASPCIAADTTLVSNIDDAGLTWRGYAQSLEYGANPLVASGDYSPDQLPFPAFESIANNADPNYAAEHILPLEQMAIDLRSSATAPNYAWYAANEDFNGEGPVDFPWGMLKFAISQVTDQQYNVPALDQFLSETVPVILASNVWNDPTESSVLVVTFDEDNNNTSLGFGNNANHIVTVVIPSPGAILDGMRSGSFTVTDYYNHYSLLRMIEDALNLPTLTNNDKFAPPMNAFWESGTGSSADSVV